jgi:Tol biopolymer transport system component
MAKRIELSGARRITSDGASFRRPAWSPDGKRLVVEASGEPEGALYLVDARGRVETRLGVGAEAAWSPDGARVAFTRVGADGRREIWVCDVAAPAQARRLAGGDGATWEHPAWSPDGARVACTSDFSAATGVRHVWLLDAVQGDRSRVTSDPARSDGHPAWSPDGRAIAFDGDDRSDDAREIDVYVHDLTAGRSSRLTDGTVACRRPVFIDRRYLVAERRSTPGPALVVLDRDRLRVLPINDRPDGEREPAVHLRARRGKRPRVHVAYVRRGAIGSERDGVFIAALEGLKVMTDVEAADEALKAALAVVEAPVDEPLPVLLGQTDR